MNNDATTKRVRTRLFFAENCNALLIHEQPNQKIYKKPDGHYIISSVFRGHERLRTTAECPVHNLSEKHQNLSSWPYMHWKNVEIRFFPEHHCSGILVHKEKDIDDTCVYRVPRNVKSIIEGNSAVENDTVTTFLYRGRQEARFQHGHKMDYPSEQLAANLSREIAQRLITKHQEEEANHSIQKASAAKLHSLTI